MAEVMMTRLDRYIGRSVAFGTVLALAVLVLLVGLSELVYQLDKVGKGDYTTGKALLFVVLTLPRFAYEFFAPAALLGSLIGLGSLANSSELIAMRAAGVSIGRIVISVLKTGVIMLFAVLIVGELLAPLSEQKAQQLRAEAMHSQTAFRSKFGFWARSGESFINVKMVMPHNRLGGITIYEFDDNQQLVRSTSARGAVYQNDAWLLTDVSQSEVSEQRVITSRSDEMAWPGLLDSGLLDVLAVQPHMLPIWGLSRYIDYLRSNGQNAINFEVAYWGKIIAPLVTLVMLLLSIPFVMGSMRNVSIGQRIFTGALFGITFFLINRSFAFLAVVYELSAPLIVSLPTVVCLVLAIGLLRRLH